MSQTVTVLEDRARPTTAPSLTPPQNQHAHTSARQPSLPKESGRVQVKNLYSCCFTLNSRYSTKVRLAAIGLALGVISLLIAIINLAPSFKGTEYGSLSVKYAQQSIALDAWQANATFRAWCQDEEEATRTLSTTYEDILRRPLSPPPPHARRALAKNLLGKAHLPRSGGRRVAYELFDYLLVLRSIVLTFAPGFCLLKYCKRPLRRMFRTIIRSCDQYDILPLFSRREHRGILHIPNTTLPGNVSGPPISILAASPHQTNASTIEFSFTSKPDGSQLRRRKLLLQINEPVVRKPLPHVMHEYLSKFYGTHSHVKDDQVQWKAANRTLLRRLTTVHNLDLEDPSSEDEDFQASLSQQEISKLQFRNAALRSDLKAMKDLLHAGFQIDTILHNGHTALHIATVYNKIYAVQFLLRKNADIASLDADGRTALHLAVIGGHKRIIGFLIRRGASVSALDYDKKRPGDYAVSVDLEDFLYETYKDHVYLSAR